MNYPSMVEIGIDLAAILILIIGIFYIKRIMPQKTTKNKVMQIIQTLAIGPRERLVLIKMGQKDIVLSVTPGHIQKITNLTPPTVKAQPASTHIAMPTLSEATKSMTPSAIVPNAPARTTPSAIPVAPEFKEVAKKESNERMQRMKITLNTK